MTAKAETTDLFVIDGGINSCGIDHEGPPGIVVRSDAERDAVVGKRLKCAEARISWH